MGYTAASHQGAIQLVCLHFWGVFTLSIFIYNGTYYIKF